MTGSNAKGSACENSGREFPLRDIYAHAATSPAGGVNTEFEDESTGKACDALNMKKSCKPAQAKWRRGGNLIEYLSKFCDTEAALYKVPVDGAGQVPGDFGAVTYPMPICGTGTSRSNCSNYRASARADFGGHGKGSWLQCQTKNCREGTPPSAAQGVFNENLDVYVWSKSPSDHYTRPWYPQIGGTSDGNKPAGVPSKWTMKGTRESGIFNQDVLKNHWMSGRINPGTNYAKSIVEQESTREDGVTCLNG